MASKNTKFFVGLFVILGLGVVVVFVVSLGMSQRFKGGRTFVAFFDESVQGLMNDSAVKYRGVEVGRVGSIDVAPDGKLVRIVLHLDETIKESDLLVAQLKSVGITGIMYVELEQINPYKPISRPKLSFEPKYPVIATQPSEIQRLLTDISTIMESIKQIDLAGISDSILETLDNTNQTLKDTQIKAISDSVRKTMENGSAILDPKNWDKIQTRMLDVADNLNHLAKSSNALISRIDRSVKIYDTELTETIAEYRNTAKRMSELAKEGKLLVSETNGKIQNIDTRLQSTFEQIDITASNLNRLVEQLSDQPSKIIFSKPLPEKKIEPYR